MFGFLLFLFQSEGSVKMLTVIIITLIICIAAIRLGNTKQSEITAEKAKKIRQSTANSAIARYQISEEQRLRLNKQKELEKELLFYKDKPNVAPTYKKVDCIDPIKASVKSMVTVGGGNADLQEPKVFSPADWWDENYDKIEQVDEETIRVNDSFLPPDHSLWADIGKYLLESGEFSDFSINGNNVIFKI